MSNESDHGNTLIRHGSTIETPMLDNIKKQRRIHYEQRGNPPTKIFMSKADINQLNREMIDSLQCEKEKRSRKRQADNGSYIYGMRIVECKSTGPVLS